MEHFRNIQTEQSNRDLRFNSVKSFADCDAYMAIEAQRAGALGRIHVQKNAWKGSSYVRGATAAVEGHYAYARSIMGITEGDYLYA